MRLPQRLRGVLLDVVSRSGIGRISLPTVGSRAMIVLSIVSMLSDSPPCSTVSFQHIRLRSKSRRILAPDANSPG